MSYIGKNNIKKVCRCFFPTQIFFKISESSNSDRTLFIFLDTAANFILKDLLIMHNLVKYTIRLINIFQNP